LYRTAEAAMTTTSQTTDRVTARRGFTLTELMVVTTLIGVMAAMSVPSFQRACEQSRADIAAANLRAIWSAERLFWLENHTYTPNLSPQTPPSLPGLVDLGLIDPQVVVSTYSDGSCKPYSYSVPAAGTATFTATATRKDKYGNQLGYFTIDQDGNVFTYDSSGNQVRPFVTIGTGSASFTVYPAFQ
jgi:prepilin-type N-terminal cleavage/methylation domain-containing protein